ncbi:MAG: toxin TcdB middle/N-terminal domain-containing protein [Aliidongia sp.]
MTISCSNLSDSSGRPELKTVTHCDGGATQSCLPAITFSWSSTTGMGSTPSVPATASGSSCSVGAMSGWLPYVVDLNNDGRDDIFWVQEALNQSVGGTYPTGVYQIWYSTDTGQKDSSGNDIFAFTCVTPSFSSASSGFAGLPFFGDFGGTGRTDILLQGMTADNPGHWAMEVNADDSGTFTSPANAFPPQQPFPLLLPSQLAVGDFEGKGRTSIIAGCQCASGSNWFSFTNSGNYSFALAGPAGNLGSNYVIYAGDFNGDGKTDILFDPVDSNGNSTGATRYIAFSLGDGTTSGSLSFTAPHALTLTGEATLSTGAAQVTVADLNGDGVADLIFDPIDGTGKSTGKRVVLLGRGDGSFDPVPATQLGALADGTTYVGYSVIAGNFTGGGFTDLILDQESATGVSTGNNVLFDGNGNGTFTQIGSVPSSPYGYAAGAQPHVADFKGVGHQGVLWDEVGTASDVQGNLLSNGTVEILYADPTQSDLIASVTSGLGAQATITYAPLSQGGALYTKDPIGTVAYPTISLQTTQPVVSSVQTSDGIGGLRTVNYSYAGLRADTQGRGGLGFGEVTATDQLTSISTETSFNQFFPLIGQPSGSTTTVPNTSSASVVTLGTTSVQYANGASFPSTVATGQPESVPAHDGEPASTLTVPVFVAAHVATVQRTDFDGAQFPSVTTTNVYDCDTPRPAMARSGVQRSPLATGIRP